MFRKENSSCSSTKPNNKNPNAGQKNAPKNNKKGGSKQQTPSSSVAAAPSVALDTPLRKSDIRNLRKTVSDFLNIDETDEGIRPRMVKQILEQTFVSGKIASRHLTHAELGKLTLYIRQPSDKKGELYSTEEEAFMWPYAVPEVIWISQPPMPNTNQVEVAVPTVALLSVLPPDIMPTVFIPSPASKSLCRGAHLMRAGMLNLPPAVTTVHSQNTGANAANTLAQLRTQANPRVVAISVRGNSQPMAVGLVDSGVQSTGDIGPNTKGIGATVWTCYGDDLWQQQVQQLKTCPNAPKIVNPLGGQSYNDGNYGNVGFLDGQRVLPIVDKNAVEEENDDDVQEPEADQQDAATAWDVNEERPGEENEVEQYENLNRLAETKAHEVEPVSADTTKEAHNMPDRPTDEGASPKEEDIPLTEEGTILSQEQILHQAVCKALLTTVNPKDLPMTVANFYASHVLPSRPPNTTIQLKQSKYKKFGNYLQEQVERGLLVLGPGPNKNSNDKSSHLTSVNKRHGDLLSYKQEHSAEVKEAKAEAQATGNRPKMVLVNLYVVPHHFVPHLRLDPDAVKATNASSPERAGTGMLIMPEVRALLDNYLERENLAQLDEVQLDGPLWDVLYKKKKARGEANNDKLTIPRKDLAEQWIAAMQPAYGLVEMPGNHIKKLGKGHPPKVQVEVSMRQSKKFVTKVRGIEAYLGLGYGQVLAKDISHRLATQATIETNPEKGAALPKGCVEIILGGNFADELEALLLGDEKLCPQHGGVKNSDYRLPKNSIDVVLRKGVPARKKKGGGAKKGK